jgi:hypothetical protein
VKFNSSTGQYSYSSYKYGYTNYVSLANDYNTVGANHGVYNAVDYPGGGFWQVYST